ncbi:unnamed protein product [Owenia fusiformis]|uniref:Peptidase S8/S53 domain-containing protein n=1 Tax=Owenia fusiformis TaxID=6347 RepID=A0A8S4NLG6_OWEFU|nr:unnamed protein product [Owenia fusiformis]
MTRQQLKCLEDLVCWFQLGYITGLCLDLCEMSYSFSHLCRGQQAITRDKRLPILTFIMKGYILAIVLTVIHVGVLANFRSKLRRASDPAKKVYRQYIINLGATVSHSEVMNHLQATRGLFMTDNDDNAGVDTSMVDGRGGCWIKRRGKFIDMIGFKAYIVSCITESDLNQILALPIVKSVQESVRFSLDTEEDLYTGAKSHHGGRVKRNERRCTIINRPECTCRRFGRKSILTLRRCCIISCVSRNVNSWGLDRLDGNLNNQLLAKGLGTDVDVYIVDSGVRYTHEEFCGRVETGKNFVNIGSSADDDNGHGTHVAGTAAGQKTGVARNANIIPVKVMNAQGSGTSAGIVSGLGWIVQQYRSRGRKAVINMSIGCPCNAPDVNNAVKAAVDEGIVGVVSAGNDNVDACSNSPAKEPSALTVASSTDLDSRSHFSNYGTCVDIYAPGSNIYSASYTSDSAYETKSGTSMAAPHVAGVVAKYLSTVSYNPSPAQVRIWLINNSLKNQITNNPYGPNDLLQAVKC